MRMALLSLPLEMLQQIAAYVETAHPSSLYNFSLTSKACHRASTFLIFRQINITVDNREVLQRDVNRLVKAISRTDSARHVQYFSIKGAMRLKAKKTDSDGQKTPYWMRLGLDEILVDEEPIAFQGPHVVYDEGVIEKSSEEDMAWAPIVDLLQAIPYLKDLVYNCKSQFPPSLLKILHEQHPQCMLHHLTFRFRTLLWGAPFPYEMELATSPSLYRVKLACGDRDTDGDDDFNLEAIMELVTGLAPNLKDVTILYLIPQGSNRLTRARESWYGLPGFTGNAVGSLTSLSLKGFSHWGSPTPLQDWAKRTDFACLQHLAIGGIHESKTIHTTGCGLNGETMEWVAQNYSFPQLRTLSLYLTRDDQFHERPHYSENAISFFQSFEPLEELSINGPIDSQIIDATLAHHGQTLKKLSLDPFEHIWGNVVGARDPLHIPMEFTKDRILQIQAQCPVLEELAIPIKRNKSSASEAEMYKCFDKMKNLRFLFLTLDCSNIRITRDSTYNPQFDEEDQKPMDTHHFGLKKGHMKEILINCAVDEALARSIWKTINQNKTGKQLERLKLFTTGGGEYGNGSASAYGSEIIQHLSQSWLIERVPRADQEDFTIRELAPRARMIEDIDVPRIERSITRQIFRNIWPSKEGSKDWRDDWSSFPLQV
jgi:hypothetical protein